MSPREFCPGATQSGVVRVLCAGHVNWDVTLQVDALPEVDGEARVHDRQESGGGSAANCASVLATLDVPAGVFGSVGSDPQGRRARRELVDAGVDVAGLVETDVGTATKHLVVDPDGRVMVLGDDRGNEAFTVEDLPEGTLAGTDLVHLTGQRAARATELARRASEAGATVSVDPGRRAGKRGFESVLALAEYVFLTSEEASGVGIDTDDPADRGDWTAPDGHDPAEDRVVVLKDGPEGARVRTPAGEVTHAGFDVDPVDTAGAGDAFAAGFLAVALGEWAPLPATGELPAGDPAERLRRALVVADACGAIAARRAGARVHLTREDVERFLAERC